MKAHIYTPTRCFNPDFCGTKKEYSLANVSTVFVHLMQVNGVQNYIVFQNSFLVFHSTKKSYRLEQHEGE